MRPARGRCHLALALISSAVLAACAPGSGLTSSAGKTLHVLATWGGDQQKSFLAMVAPWEARTGNHVAYEGTRDLNTVLTARLQRGDPPDLAALPGPGPMAEFVEAGRLIPLNDVIDMNQLAQQYASSWIQMGSVNGRLYGIVIRADPKGLIWFDPKVGQAAGLNVTPSSAPRTWVELAAIASQLVTAGKSPWCIGLESGVASGWPGTDWVEDFVLRTAGPQTYTGWYQGSVKWTSPEIRAAWRQFGTVVSQSYGGANVVLTTNFGRAGDPLFTHPPGCYLYHQESSLRSDFEQNNAGIQPVIDFNFFGFPNVNPRYSQAEEVTGDLLGLFKDSPEARSLIAYLATPEAQQIWVSRGGALTPNRQVPLSKYPDQLSRESGQILTGAEITVFDASDNMPDAMTSAFWRGILDYVADPGKLDSILASLDVVQATAYKSA